MSTITSTNARAHTQYHSNIIECIYNIDGNEYMLDYFCKISNQPMFQLIIRFLFFSSSTIKFKMKNTTITTIALEWQ